MISKRTAFVWALILVFLTSIFTFVITNSVEINTGDRVVISKNDYQMVKTVEKLLGLKEYIKKNYVENVDDSKLMEGAMKGLFESLGDPYSVYMSKNEYKNFNEAVKGTYGGIGVVVSKSKEGYVTVVAPIEDSPGEKAGLKTNDKIIKVGDKDVVGVELDAAVALMKGKPGTQVVLTVLRDDQRAPLTFTITRQEIEMKSVKGKMLDSSIGYIRISSFDEDTGSEFRRVLKELEGKNMKGLIIDLRQNPGGYVSQCIEVADELLDKGMIVYTEDREKNREVYNSKDGKVNVPYVLLVDEGSASASEILSGAVKDRKAGLLIGTKTFGKGLVQTPEELKDGSGFKLTTQKYYTPNGISINKVGIQPDIEVKLPEAKPGQKAEDIKDTQLDKAIEVIKKEMK